MGPVIDDHDVTVWQGDARTVLAELPAGSVQCIVTSPPYYGLRDYGTGTWDGGDPNCDHASQSAATGALRKASSGLGGGKKTTGNPVPRAACPCGASRGDRQIGLEASPAEYVEQLRAVFAEARRVLADDGVMFLNLGDSFAGGGYGNHAINGEKWLADAGLDRRRDRQQRLKKACESEGIKPKDLIGIPWEVAFALRADGWWLRNDIIWSKPNAMPESVTDRLSTRHEHVFLFTRSRRYSFNLDAIREPHITADRVLIPAARASQAWSANSSIGSPQQASGTAGVGRHDAGRNPGDVWSIPTTPTPYAHFATMPPELARRCIQAGCPESGTVLDPFAGSGTTLMVARQLGRRAVGIELNPGYVDIIRRRIGQEPLNFDEAVV